MNLPNRFARGVLVIAAIGAVATIGMMRPAAIAGTPVVVTDGTVKLKPDSGTTVVATTFSASPSTTDTGTLTTGSVNATCSADLGSLIYAGYSNGLFGLTFGTYTPTTLTGGHTVKGVAIISGSAGCASRYGSYLNITGFTANPGTSWLTSIKCGTVTLASSAATFSYASGSATWFWHNSFLPVSVNTSCTIIHT